MQPTIPNLGVDLAKSNSILKVSSATTVSGFRIHTYSPFALATPKLLPFENLYLEISAVGYASANKEFQFIRPGEISSQNKDVGNIILARTSQKLEGIVITATAPAMKMGIDKKIFSVDNML